jgi:hypothetical protein
LRCFIRPKIACCLLYAHRSCPGAVLVHGTVTGQGPIAGMRYGHAWIEVGDVVLDPSNGRFVCARKSAYYAAGEIRGPVARHFDRLDSVGALPKTIIYNLNPRDNEVVATMLGNFQDGITAGKMQFGSGWWFLDQLDGMTRQIEALSQMGLLSCFVGMLTDSRSFLSYTRHEYFRRLLCNILGRDMQRGLVPDDEALVGPMVRDICYGNARTYFGFGNS